MADVPAKVSFIERVSATTLTVRPLKVLLAVLTFPFYVLGWMLGLLIVVGVLILKAVKTGIVEARAKATPTSPAVSAGAD